MPLLTKGTQLFFIDPADYSVVKVTKLIEFNTGGAPTGNVDVTDLEETDSMNYVGGLKDPGQATGTINATPSEDSHGRLKELYDDGAVVKWVMGMSDGTDLPEADTNGNWELSTARSFFTFDGFIADFSFNNAINDVVKTPLVIQRSGSGTWSKKAA